MDSSEKIHLAEMRWNEIENLSPRESCNILLPVGSLEAHGPHLPLGTDTLQAEKIAALAASRVRRTFVLPAIAYGHCVDTMNFAGTIHVGAAAICAMIRDIAAGLSLHGFRRLVVVNGHGGNKAVLETALREALAALTPAGQKPASDFQVYLVNLYQRIAEKLALLVEGRDYGHACELETSVMLELDPGSVDMESAGEEYLPGGTSDRIWRIRDVSGVSETGVHGAPRYATREKGEKVVRLLVDDLVEFLESL